jgi:endonuclease/exonuclease/phosphatase (EEP) superfamily protein YafD
MLLLIYSLFVIALALLVLFVTLAPMTQSARWWIRGWDFPRVQIAGMAAIVAGLALFVDDPLRLGIILAMVASGIYQAWRIYPFTPLAREDISLAERHDDDIRCLAINVEMGNDRYDDVARVIREVDADIVFLMETDQTWVDRMEDALSRYDTIHREPLDNYYGLVWATRLKVGKVETVQLTVEKTPTLFALLEDRAGRAFRFVGLHPKPPVPGVDTEERDAQTLYAACFARDTDEPVVIMGDFNDAAWSDTAYRFTHAGRYMDVRAGRGFYSSFHARYWWFRCPIDQLYVTEGVAVSHFEIGPYVGSDHFPVIARLNFDPDRAARHVKVDKSLSAEEQAEIEAEVERHRARLIDSADDGA